MKEPIFVRQKILNPVRTRGYREKTKNIGENPILPNLDPYYSNGMALFFHVALFFQLGRRHGPLGPINKSEELMGPKTDLSMPWGGALWNICGIIRFLQRLQANHKPNFCRTGGRLQIC